MKKPVALVLALISLLLVSCVKMETYYPSESSLVTLFSENRALFSDAVASCLEIGEDCFISTTDYWTPKNAGDISGLYVSNVDETEVRPLEDKAISALFDTCDVRSAAFRVEGELKAVEFNCGGSRNYYCGVYYVSKDAPVYIGNFSAELTESADGFLYQSGKVRYFTKKLSDNFYYFDAGM